MTFPTGPRRSNTPFREYKCWVQEGGIATPLIVRWPGGDFDAGRYSELPAPAHRRDAGHPGLHRDAVPAAAERRSEAAAGGRQHDPGMARRFGIPGDCSGNTKETPHAGAYGESARRCGVIPRDEIENLYEDTGRVGEAASRVA